MDRPKWAKDYMKQTKAVPDQVTIIGSGGRRNGNTIPFNGAMQNNAPFYTGSGANGVVEPDKPAAIDFSGKKPAVYHEGELGFDVIGGRQIIPADQTKGLVVPKTEDQQRQLSQIEKNGLPGFKEGGLNPTEQHNLDMIPSYANYTPPKTVPNEVINPTTPTNSILPPVFNSYNSPATVAPNDLQRIMDNPSLALPKPPVETKTAIGAVTPTTPIVPQMTIGAPVTTDVSKMVTGTKTDTNNVTPQITIPIDQTPVTPAPAPAPTPVEPVKLDDSQFKTGYEDAYKKLVDVMNGMSPTDKLIADRLLMNYDAADAANSRATYSKISNDPNMSDSAKRRLMFEVDRTSNTGRSNLLGTIAESQMSNAQNAAKDVFNYGQTAEKFNQTTRDADWTRALNYYDPTTPEGLKTLQDMYVQKFGGTPPDLSELIKERKYLDLKRQSEVDASSNNSITSRIAMLYSGGKNSFDEIANDATIRSDVASAINADDKTPEGKAAITAEIQNRINAYQVGNTDTFAGNLEKLIGNAFETFGTEDVQGGHAFVLNDNKIRNAAAGFLGIDPLSENINDQQKINDYINKVWDTGYAKTESKAIFEKWKYNYSSSLENMKDTPGWEGMAIATIEELNNKGQIDSDGKVLEGAVIDWPWNDPDTYFKFTDFNGNNISYDTEGNKPDGYDNQVVKVNGKPFEYTDAVTGEKSQITFGAAQAAWNDATASEREDYSKKKGYPDIQSFLKDKFGTTKVAQGTVFNNMTDYNAAYESGDWKTYFDGNGGDVQDNIADNFSAGTYPAGSQQGDENTPIPAGQFLVYDKDGNTSIKKSSGLDARNIYMQLSTAIKGSPMNLSEFQSAWGDGSKYRIGDDGKILNFTEEFKPYVDQKTYQIDTSKIDPSQGKIPDSVIDATVVKPPEKFVMSDDQRNGNTGSKEYKTNGSNGGENWSFRTRFNDTIYEPNKSDGTTVSFNNEFKTWAEDNRGSSFVYNGYTYTIPAKNSLFGDPVSVGKAAHTQGVTLNVTSYAQPFIVYDADGKQVKLTFDTYPESIKGKF
jgi:hypothetical protein